MQTRGGGGPQIQKFCGHHKWMGPDKQNRKIFENCALCVLRKQLYFRPYPISNTISICCVRLTDIFSLSRSASADRASAIYIKKVDGIILYSLY